MSDPKHKLLIYFEYLLKYANDITIIADFNFNIIDANDLSVQIYGYSKNEFLKLSFYDLISPESKVDIETQIKILNQKDFLTFVTKSLKKHGSIFIAEVKSSLIRLDNEVYYKIIVKDISERNKLEAQLFEERGQLRTIIDASPASIWFKDTKNNFIRVNKAAAEIANKSVGEIEGKSTQFIFPVESDKYYADDLEVINSGIPKIGIIESVTTGNSVKWVRTDKIPWINAKGEIAGVIAFSLDITQQKQTEQLLSQESNLLSSLLDNIPDRIYAKDLEHRFIIYNKALANRWGFNNPRELVGKSDFDLFPYEVALKYRSEEQEIIRTGKSILNREESMTDSSGQTHWSIVTKSPFWDDNGNIIGIAGLSRDITELKVAAEALKASEEKYRSLFNTAPLGIAHINFKMEITDCNNMLLDILDIPENESLGFDFKKIEDIKLKNAIELAFAGSIGCYEGDFQSISSHKIISLKAMFSPIVHEKEKILSVVGIFEDISEYKQIERFFFHDILNTVGNLRSFADLLKDNLLDNKVNSSLLSDVRQIAAISDKVIQEIISHRSILTSGKTEIKLNLTTISTSEFIGGLIRNIFQKVTEVNKEIIIADNFENIMIQTDQALLSRVIENLIKNAIEASLPGGVVTIGCQKENEQFSFGVHNQTTISEEIKAKIFERSFSTKGPGRGIGTYSIKFLTEKYLKGNVSFVSTVKEGTTFKIVLPINLISTNHKPSLEPCKEWDNKKIIEKKIASTLLKGKKKPDILLVEDDEITTHVTKLFSKKVFNVDSVTNGPSAIEAVKSKPYSAILMDIHLGRGMSGLDTLKIIRTIHGYENIPIIAFTAYAMQGSKKDFLAAGCTHYLVKPFTKDQLIDILNEAINPN